MKKIILSLAAVLAFGIASAQTEPKPVKREPAKTNSETDKAKKDAEIQSNILGDTVQARKDEIKTRDHVKSTPDPDRKRDSVAAKKKVKKMMKRN